MTIACSKISLQICIIISLAPKFFGAKRKYENKESTEPSSTPREKRVEENEASENLDG